jgi:hypothetical protein
LRQEQLDEARRHFTAVQAEAPDNESAAEGLALVASMEKPKASWSYAAYAGLVGELYSEPAFGSTTTGAGAAGSAGVGYGPFATSVTYQYMLYQTPETTSSGSGSGEMHGRETTTTRSEQRHELHASAAWAKKSWGVSLHYGGAFSDALLNGNAFGVVGRVSPLGDVTLEASYATFDDGVGVARVTPAWRIPIGPRFFVTPGAAFQADDEGRARGAGLLNAGLDTDSVTAVIGGRVGRQYRAVYFAVPSIQSVEGVEQYSAWASLAAGLGGGWEAVVAYVFSRFEPVAGSTEPFDEHTASIGIRKPIW